MKKWLALSLLLVIFSCIAGLFWYNEWKFSLPTPVPESYHKVATGSYITLPATFSLQKSHPVFLHFFNPDCPCSRFNIPHFKSLSAAYADKIDFAVIVMTNNKSYTEEVMRKKYGLAVRVLFDTSIARAVGVYSTPQAVLLDKNHILYFRGNYNRDRYCTDKKSNYAKMAIDSLLADNRQTVFNPYALVAYGCSLSTCKK